jgi:2-iminobutanoate/2-iminopropanoate deaminase
LLWLAARCSQRANGGGLNRRALRCKKFGADERIEAMAKRAITSAKSKPIGPYSPAIQAGDLLFISGQTPLDAGTGKLVEGDISEQARQCLENLKAILEAAGLGFAHVLKTNIFLTNMADFAAVNAVYKSYFEEPYPARSTVAVAALPMGAAVEIELIASRSAQ